MTIECPYCGLRAAKLKHQGVHHKVDPTFGPFDLLECQRCGSLGTSPLPTLSRLAEFYSSYRDHRPDWYNAALKDNALSSQYQFYARFLMSHLRKGGTWADVGAGHGEVSSIISSQLPKSAGTAIDIGERPKGIPDAVEYIPKDLNKGGWASSIAQKFDLVFAVAVWEHVVNPAQFAAESLSLVAEGGKLILITPDNGSLAAKVLGKRWPYFEPGEHLSIPTRAGAIACLHRAAVKSGLDEKHVSIAARRLSVGYSIRYVLQVLRVKRIAKLVPTNLAAPLPTGILAAIAQRA